MEIKCLRNMVGAALTDTVRRNVGIEMELVWASGKNG